MREIKFILISIICILGVLLWVSSCKGDTSYTGNPAPVVEEPAIPTTQSTTLSKQQFLQPLRSRNDLGALAEQLNFTVGLEIGVYRGLFAELILKQWPSVKTYYCLDAWQHQENYHDIVNKKNQKEFNALFEETKKRLAPWKDKVKYVRSFSNLAASQFANDSLDYIYVDARHDYKGVAEDLALYWPKLREGGVFAGHDFLDATDVDKKERQKKIGKQDWSINGDGTNSGGKAVRSAVLEFSATVNKQVLVTFEDGLWPSWYFLK
eukprot:TRINITY_DN57743_c0_g1_i1.p1 TRINITY_DN57743_c0_g1~~TRINITY_DN57743_c0_g1_i1.p1  ORF type:complete len:265 (+),score=16.25 TRINITY_DN57743_c0_g1_i1:149-943(+)